MEADLKELVKLRNQAAKELGFKNYHALQLYLNEQSQDAVIKLFDELDDLTREPFLKAKAEIDARLAKSYGIEPGDLSPGTITIRSSRKRPPSSRPISTRPTRRPTS